MVSSEYYDNEGRYIILKLKINKVDYVIGNYYGPNKDDPSHARAMIEKIEEIANPNIIICGDYNFVFNLNMDKTGGNKKTNIKCRQIFRDWMEDNRIQDIWRTKNPTTRKYTWKSNTKPPIMCRLDMILISETIANFHKQTDIVPGFKSDHACVTLTIEENEEARGRGFWKFNCQLFKNPNFKTQLVKTIEETVSNNKDTGACLLWDTIKCSLRGTCIGIAARTRKEYRVKLDTQNKMIVELDDALCKAIVSKKEPSTIKHIEESLKQAKEEHEQTIEEETRGSALRSKCQTNMATGPVNCF